LLDSGSASSCTSSVVPGVIGTSGPVAAPPQHFGFRHDASNWHGYGDCGPLDLCSCQHNAHDISIWGLRLLHGADDIAEVYVPSTTVASGGVASAP
jgi:hypothetical protein